MLCNARLLVFLGNPCLGENAYHNRAMGLSLIHILFQGVMDMSDFLSIDKTRQSRWQDILEKLSEYPLGITEDGRQSLKNMEKGPQDKEVRPSGLNRVSTVSYTHLNMIGRK